MRFDHFTGGVLATSAAVGDRQVHLHLIKRRGASIYDFADLAIANGVTKADVHVSRLQILDASEYK